MWDFGQPGRSPRISGILCLNLDARHEAPNVGGKASTVKCGLITDRFDQSMAILALAWQELAGARSSHAGGCADDQRKVLTTIAATKAAKKQTGNVISQAIMILFNTAHRTSDTLRLAAAPTMPLVMVCVVERGMPNRDAPSIVNPADA